MSRRAGRISAWILAGASVLIALVYAANVPFYSGSSVGPRLSWRMEHGRLRVVCRPSPRNSESFYVAVNNEGLKFAPDWHVYSAGDWFFNVPLWLPLGMTALGSAGLFFAMRERRKPGVCGKCGYDLRGLPAGTMCPECGKQGASRAG